MKKTLIVALLAAFVAAFTVNSYAADKPADKPGDAKKSPRAAGRPFRGTIKSFDKATQTLTLEGEKAQAVTVTSATRIVKDAKPATTDALTAGEMVSGYGREVEGKLEAVTIRVGKPTPRPAAPADKPKGEEKK
jgi:hypothetical protein